MSKKAFALACATQFALVASLGSVPAAFAAAPTTKAIMKNYGDIAEAMYSDALAKAKDLDKAIDAFLAAPSTETLQTARDAWKASRVPYMQTEGFRFGNKIVDDWEGNVNSWPLDEGLIDYVDKASYGDTKEENPLYTANIIANQKIRLGPKFLTPARSTKRSSRSSTAHSMSRRTSVRVITRSSSCCGARTFTGRLPVLANVRRPITISRTAPVETAIAVATI